MNIADDENDSIGSQIIMEEATPVMLRRQQEKGKRKIANQFKRKTYQQYWALKLVPYRLIHI